MTELLLIKLQPELCSSRAWRADLERSNATGHGADPDPAERAWSMLRSPTVRVRVMSTNGGGTHSCCVVGAVASASPLPREKEGNLPFRKKSRPSEALRDELYLSGVRGS